jgi:drug/metabolite transporter (DMT)-like permease
VFLARAGDVPHPSPLWAIAGARLSALCVTLVLLATGRRRLPWPGRRMPLVAVVGILDTSANVLYIFASMHGALGVVGVLGSMYPVATVLLSRFVLAERLSWPQHAGVALALAGVLLLSTG